MSSEAVAVPVRVHRASTAAVVPRDDAAPSCQGAPRRERAAADQLELLEREHRRLQQRLHELLADLERLQRRGAEEQRQARRQGENLAVQITRPALEALEQAREQLAGRHPEVDTGLAAAIAAIEHGLAQAGFERIPDRGVPFDPTLHDALACEPSTALAPGTVARVLAPGFRRDDEVVVPARVTVAAAPVAPVEE